ncbi:MAG: hypothetical protein LUD01_11545 [Clostridiales bacterium]|nr:hypothetical protein [Clostridiales bacterium]
MEIQLTYRAAAEYDHLRMGSMTPAMAAEYLQDGKILLRSFQESLREQYPYPDLQLRLVNSFRAYEPDASPASVTKKIQNWLSGKNQPSSREDIFRIAFALDLTETQTNFLLGQCTDYGIHYRDGKDVIYTWFLRNDYGYEDARNFYESLPAVPYMMEFPQSVNTHITKHLQNDFYSVHSVEKLRRVYIKNLSNFGTLHVRAYQYFEKYLHQLIHPDTGWDSVSEEDYSLESVMEQYLSLQMPSRRNRTRYSVTQKLLKQNWPNATALKNIRAHRADVPRKLLLILYVVTENVVDDDYSELDEDYLSIQDRLNNHWWILNAILTDCGMPLLDPRNVTDWLVLYALTADEDESMSERMASVIDNLFQEEHE